MNDDDETAPVDITVIDEAIDLMMTRLKSNPAIIRAGINVKDNADTVAAGLKEAGRVLTERDPDFGKQSYEEIAAKIIAEKNEPDINTPQSSRDIYDEAHQAHFDMADSAKMLAKGLGGGTQGIKDTLLKASTPALAKALEDVVEGTQSRVNEAGVPSNAVMEAEQSFTMLSQAINQPTARGEQTAPITADRTKAAPAAMVKRPT